MATPHLGPMHDPGGSDDPGHEGRVVASWSLVNGDIHVRIEEADWWGATLSILIAAIHQPATLAEQQPDTNPAAVAEQVLDELDILRDAVELVEQAPQAEHTPAAQSTVVSARGEGPGRVVVISPGPELRQLVWLLDLFAHAVLDPGSNHHRTARGATAYSAAAWSRDLGVATGAVT
jgi:hypothetical protein